MATGFFRYNPIFLSAAKKESKVPSPYNLSFPDLPKIRLFRAYSFIVEYEEILSSQKRSG
jgi:hypothetical protein